VNLLKIEKQVFNVGDSFLEKFRKIIIVICREVDLDNISIMVPENGLWQ
jgi:hypothetical protein